jgi:PAS domain S-box-containing protein
MASFRPGRGLTMREVTPLSEPRGILVATVFTSAVLAVLAAFLMVRHLESTRIRLEFERASGERMRAVQAELDSYINDLHAISAFFRASEEVTRSEFGEFARPLHARHGGIRAFDWVPRVSDREREDYERRRRGEFPEFRITELDSTGALATAPSRPEYFPIDYIEPVVAGDELVRGFDLASHPLRRAALYASRDEGAMRTAGPLPLLVDRIDSSGYLVFLPHYRGGDTPATPEARRAAFVGVIVGVFQLSEALRDAVAGHPSDGVDVEIADAGNVVALVRTTAPEEAPAAGRARSRSAVDYALVDGLPFADRNFEVRCLPTPAFVARHASRLPWIVLAGGAFFVAALLFYFVRLRNEMRERQRADNALRESERRYRVLVEHAPEAIVVFDVDRGHFVDVNENAVRLFKLSREQLLGMSPEELSPRLQPDGRASASIIKALIAEAMSGAAPMVPWVHRDSAGREIPCEVRLVRLPPLDRALVRGSIIDVSDRRQAELRQLMMARELDHRVKNNLAEVLALVDQSGTSASSYDDFREAFAGRVRAMARTHEALAAHHWQGVPLREVAELMLGPYGGSADGRIVKHGDPVMLAPTASSALGMMLHELAANAAKHGALAVALGRVELRWRRDDTGALEILWHESGGPPVSKPETVGFGLRLVRGVATHELGGTLETEFHPAGLRCVIRIPSEHVLESEQRA